MKLAAAALIVAIAAQDAQPPAEPDWVKLLPPRKAIAGLAGFHSTSRLVYAEAPDREHVLETTYVFPGRVRWYLALVDGEPGDRVIEYRCGDAYFEFGEGAEHSRRIESMAGREFDDAAMSPEELAQTCYASELRRALFLWPDGFDWAGDGDLRAARVECRDAFGFELRLEALLGADGRPTRVALQSGNFVWEGYTDIAWREHRGRWWPVSMQCQRADSKVWTETVDSVETSIHLLDEFFVPPDRRTSASASRTASEIAPLDVAATAVSRAELADKTDWPAALARAKSWRADARERAAKAKRGIEPALLIELDASGDPCAVLARLAGDGALPDGFVVAPARRAMTRWVPCDPSAIESALAELRARVPADSRTLAAYVRVPSPDAPDPLAQLVLPFEPPP